MADEDAGTRKRGREEDGVRVAEPPQANEVSADAAKQAAAAGPASRPAPGVYMPPFRLAQLMAQEAAQDKAGPQYQRLTWDALRKSINALVNKVTAQNVKNILHELFRENLDRGKGLLCRSLVRSQLASPTFTPCFAALVAVVNSRFPDIGALLCNRVLLQFKRAYRRNDRPLAVAAVKFIAHLTNQQVLPEVLAFEIVYVLLDQPTEDSVEMAVNFIKEIGAFISDTTPALITESMDVLRKIAANGSVEQRTVFMIEELFRVRRVGFEESGFPVMPAELDLLEAQDRNTHNIKLEDKMEPHIELDVFRTDPEYEAHEASWAAIRAKLFGDDEDEDEDDEEGVDESGESGDEDSAASEQEAAPMSIQDATETNLINLRRTIYLTIMSAMDFEEAGHKLLKIGLADGQESEVVIMIIECCSQEKTYLNYYGLLAQRFSMLHQKWQALFEDCVAKHYYGLLAQRFSMLHQKWQALFEDCFAKQYALIHRLETNKLRNVAKFFAHLLYTDAISWVVLGAIRLTEDDTTSSSRIFVKILFQEMAENMGLKTLNERLQDPMAQPWVQGVFPRDTPRNMRFAINFFTSIGLGGVTDALRAHLKDMPKLIAAQQAAAAQAAAQDGSSSDSSDSDSDSSDSDSSSGSGSDSDSSDSSTSSGSPPPPKKGGSKRSVPSASVPLPGPPPRLEAERRPERAEEPQRRDEREHRGRSEHAEEPRRRSERRDVEELPEAPRRSREEHSHRDADRRRSRDDREPERERKHRDKDGDRHSDRRRSSRRSRTRSRSASPARRSRR